MPSEYKSRHLWIDFTFVNIFAPSYIKTAAKYRGKVAQQKQENKLQKYKNDPNIFGIGVEVLGAMSSNGKTIINEIAKRLEIKDNTHHSIHINRIRSNILATMMYHNSKMIIKCYDL